MRSDGKQTVVCSVEFEVREPRGDRAGCVMLQCATQGTRGVLTTSTQQDLGCVKTPEVFKVQHGNNVFYFKLKASAL